MLTDDKSFKKVYVVLFFVFLTLLLWQVLLRPSQLNDDPKVNLPNATLHDFVKNTDINIKDLKGKPFMIHFWATWCGVCTKEHATWLEFSRDQHMTVVGVNFHDKPEMAREYLSRQGNPFEFNLLDPNGEFGLALGLKGTPETFVVNDKGKVVLRHTGPVSINTLKNELVID